MAKEALPLLREFGKRFQEAREAAGVTQPQLAEAARVNQSDISKLENGKQGLAIERFLRLLKAARLLGVRVDHALTSLGPMVIAIEDPAIANRIREVIERHPK